MEMNEHEPLSQRRLLRARERGVVGDRHSINRVKRAMRHAEGKTSVRARRLYIACRKWLGTWGPSTIKGQVRPT